MVTVHEIAILVMGFTMGVLVWQITNIIRDTRWLGQERRKDQRRKEDPNAL